MESENKSEFSRISANNLLVTISNKKGSLKARKTALISLSETKLFPDTFTNPKDFLENCIAPVVSCFDDDSDAIRENSVMCILKILPQMTTKQPEDIYRIVSDKTFNSIEHESTEEVSILLVQLVKYMSELPESDTIPTTFDHYTPKAITCIAKKLREKNPEMLKLCCTTVESLIKHSTKDCLLVNSTVIVPPLLVTCSHNQLAVRKLALKVLGSFYVASGAIHSLDGFVERQNKFMQDSKQAFRTALVNFCSKLLTKHPQRQGLYADHLYPLLVSLYKIVPSKPISPNEVIEPIAETKELNESYKAFDALVKIGEQYKKDSDNLRDKEEIQVPFDEKRTYGIGLLTLIQTYFRQYLTKIKENLADFKANIRHLGYAALISLMHLSKEYSARYAPDILPKLIILLGNYPDESEIIYRSIALLSSLTPLSDINNIVLPKLTLDDCQAHELEAYSVCLLNAPCQDEDLSTAILSILDKGLWKNSDNANSCAQCVLSVCKRNESYKASNIVDILHLMLRIGENGDALKHFGGCFDKPINQEIGEHLSQLLEIRAKTPRFIEQVLTNAPIESLQQHNQLVCDTIISGLRGYESRTKLYHLTAQMCDKGGITYCTDDLIQSILDDMIWTESSESNSTRESATTALGMALKTNAFSGERMEAKINEIYAMTLASLSDQSSDSVRSSAIVTLKEVILHSKSISNRFEGLYDALKNRLSDSLLQIRVASVDLLCIICPRCTDNELVPQKMQEIIIFLDDESVEMREAITRFAYTVAEIQPWKESVINALNHIILHRYHPEAEIQAKEILSKIK